MMTLDDGRMRTCLLPFRSALTMLFKQSFKTETRVMMAMWSALRGKDEGFSLCSPAELSQPTHEVESCEGV